MNTKFAIILSGILFTMLGSCTDYMDPYPNGAINEEDFWNRQELVQGLIGQCYEYMDRTYDNNNGYYLDGATDDAVLTSTTHALSKLSLGSLTSNNDPFSTYWSNDYKAIALANRFLKNRRGFNTRFLTNDRLNNLLRNRLQGEAYALRAWFQWDLLQRWGGIGIVSKDLLGFPIVTEPVNIFNDNLNLKRNTYEECVNQIIADCDSAYKYLPIAHRDYLVQNSGDLLYAGGRYWGRLDGITMVALKANAYLTWASPLFNPTGDGTRWEKAALYAKEVMDFKLTKDNVTSGFNPVNPVIWTNPNFAGIVFGSRWNDGNDAMERALYPGGFQGNGVIGASQDLVDAFPMKNGYPKEHPMGAAIYNPDKPYENRDPRFYSMIFFNGAVAKKNNTGVNMYTFESWSNSEDGSVGKDSPSQQNTSRTGYHIKKYIFMNLNWSDASPSRAPHSKFFIRWAHLVLNFAEAANEIGGPNDKRFGLSAKEAIAYLRTRKTYDNASLFTTDPYLTDIANQGKDAFREFVKNEGRIEKCFEGMRFYDQRRWATNLTNINKPVRKVVITKNVDGTFEYDYSQVVENRSFNSMFLPIPYSEILRMNSLEQNEGWDKWK